MTMLEKILELNSESTKEQIMSVVEYDLKNETKYRSVDHSIDKFFFWKGGTSIEGLENSSINTTMYEELHWQKDDIECFDIMNSFQGIYALGLRIYYPEYFNVEENAKMKVQNLEWEVDEVLRGHNGEIMIHTVKNSFENGRRLKNLKDHYSVSITQNIYSSLFLKQSFYKYKRLNEIPELIKIAQLTHSIGNFMPCPSGGYNTNKGISGLYDLFELQYKRIYEYNNENFFSGLREEQKNQYISWMKWFEKYKSSLLIDYYEAYPSIPDFKNRNLHDNINMLDSLSQEEYLNFMRMIIAHIHIRGLNIVLKITKEDNVKMLCRLMRDEIIEDMEMIAKEYTYNAKVYL